jgi:pyruvate dehydrogenase E2 component (dihydrolipoamide acetyltransferase)
VSARQNLNARRETKVSLNAFLMKFVAETLKRHPMVNSTWNGETIVKHAKADIALAMSQEDGLVAPVVRDCGAKGVVRIDEELKVLIDRARQNRLTAADYANSTFTISNLGSFGIEEFTAIINPPNSAILAVGMIEKRPVVDENDHVRIQQMMRMTLSCDHRVIDGAVGAEFLRDLKEMIEYPVQELY